MKSTRPLPVIWPSDAWTPDRWIAWAEAEACVILVAGLREFDPADTTEAALDYLTHAGRSVRVREAARLLLQARWVRRAVADGAVALATVRALELGALAERLHLAPRVEMAEAVSDGGAKGGRARALPPHQAARWQQELEAARDADPEHFKLGHAQAKIAHRDGVNERTVRRHTSDPRRGQ
jgi:hypothetical protein